MAELTPFYDLNAFTLNFDPELLRPLQHIYKTELETWLKQHPKLLCGGHIVHQQTASPHFYAFSYNKYPLLWLSNHSAEAYAYYRDFFDALTLPQQLQKHVDSVKAPIMYSGFFVVGNQAPDLLWHYDYRAGAQAYTLITPLFELQSEHGHLRYEKDLKTESIYHYKMGEAILFGAGFLHSTEPYAPTKELRVLLSLTCGSDKAQHWPLIRKSIERQSQYYLQGCGHIAKQCRCWSRFKFKRF